MLSAVIGWEYSYPAMLLSETTGTPGIPSSQSSRTRDESPQISTIVQDRDRTVLRRSEPSSRTTLTGEQPDPWDLLQPQDVMSRHRDSAMQNASFCYQKVLTIPSSPVILIKGELVFYRSHRFCKELLSSVPINRDIQSIRERCYMVPLSLGVALSDRLSRRGSPILTSKFFIPMHSLKCILLNNQT
jgi:hypothetical protein